MMHSSLSRECRDPASPFTRLSTRISQNRSISHSNPIRDTIEGPIDGPSEISIVMIDRDFSDIVHGEDYEFHNLDGQTPLLLSSLNPIFLLRKFSDMQLVSLAGAGAGFFAGIMVCPLDVIKTRLQAQGALSRAPQYSGFYGAFRKILQVEGIRGLYRGLVPITIGYLPTWTIYFSVYERAKTYYPNIMGPLGVTSDTINHCMAAVTAGMALSVAVNPIWVVKTRLMIQGSYPREELRPAAPKPTKRQPAYYRGTIDAFRQMYKQEGVRVFYSGLVPSMFGLVHVGIHFPIYERLKKVLRCDHTSLSADNSSYGLVWRLIVASLASKMLASTITYPHEILRTRMQMQHATEKIRFLQAIKNIYAKQGVRGFYAGYSVNMVRTVPSSAVTLVSFEFIKHYLLDNVRK